MKITKPIKVSCGEFVTDSNFNPIMFTIVQATRYADDFRRRLEKEMKCKLKLKGVKDCGEYWTWTIG